MKLRYGFILIIVIIMVRSVSALAQDAALRPGAPQDICIFEAAKLYPSEVNARGGKVVDDPEATSGGKALQVVSSRYSNFENDGIFFGFGKGKGPVGEVVTTFRLKVSSIREAIPSFYIAVKGEGVYPIAKKLLTPQDFGKENTYRDFSLHFMRTPDKSYAAAILWKSQGSATVTVDTITLKATGKSLGIGNLKPEKLWYRANETASGNITVANHTDQPQKATLRCQLVNDIENVRNVYESTLTLAPREITNTMFSFNAGKVDWSYELRACLLQNDQVVTTASDVITIGDNFYKISAFQGYGLLGHRGQEGGGTHFPIRDFYVPQRRQAYCAVVEIFAWPPGMGVDMTPEGELWRSGQNNYPNSMAGIKNFIDECHKQGLAVVSYDANWYSGPAGFDWARANPELLSYREDGRPNCGFDIAEMEKMRNPDPPNWIGGGSSSGGLWILDDRLIDHMADELIAASKMFGFDGVRWDGHPMITGGKSTMVDQTVMVAKLIDYTGRVVNIKDPDTVSTRIMRRFNARVRKALPNFQFGYNWGPTHAIIWPEEMPKLWQALVPDAYILDEDLHTRGLRPDPNNFWTRYAKNVVKSVEYVKPYNGYHYTGTIYTPGVCGQHLQALIYASGSRWCGGFTGLPEDYFKFALRYSELLFSSATKRVKDAEKIIEVNSPQALWWKDYVYTWNVSKS
ncbi:MAG: hypothetical protein L6437_06440, partial [Kiritimatiellae bacterium]|nr:hypothetical protein [Kiritimatiellia bacterium]